MGPDIVVVKLLDVLLDIGVTAVSHGSHGHGHDRDQFLKKFRDRDVTVTKTWSRSVTVIFE
jgi:argininosuccinate synthase